MRNAQNKGAPRRSLSLLARAVLTLVGIALFIGFISLGTWQVQRRAWKLDLIERTTERVHHAPVALPAASSWPQITAASAEYLPVQVQGVWLDKQSVLSKAVTEDGAGFWLMTPLQLADGTQVLVNRGFTAEKNRSMWLKHIGEAGPSSQQATVIGLLRMSEPGGGFLRENNADAGLWFSRDVAAIAQAQGLKQAAPFFIDQGVPARNPAHAQAKADSAFAQDVLRPGMTVISFTNTHLVYALTWYGLALMVLLGAWLVVRYERRGSSVSE